MQIAAVEIFDDGVVEAVPSGALLLVHAAYEVMIGAFEAAVFVGAVHLEVVDDVHILEDAHLLRGSGRASGIRSRRRSCEAQGMCGPQTTLGRKCRQASCGEWLCGE